MVWVSLAVTLVFMAAAYLTLPMFHREYETPPRQSRFYQPGRNRELTTKNAAPAQAVTPEDEADPGPITKLKKAPPGSIKPHRIVDMVYLLVTTKSEQEIDQAINREDLIKRSQQVVTHYGATAFHEYLLSFLKDEKRITIERKPIDQFPEIAKMDPGEFGRGLSERDVKTIGDARWVVEIHSTTGHYAFKLNPAAIKVSHFGLLGPQLLAGVLSRDLDAVVIDTMTGEMLSHHALRQRMINPFNPIVTRHMTVDKHVSEQGTYTLYTRGLHKLGMPDLLLANIPLRLETPARLLLEGAAHQILDQFSYKPGQRVRVHCPLEIQVTMADVMAANEKQAPLGNARSCRVRVKSLGWMKNVQRLENTPADVRQIDRLELVAPNDRQELGTYWAVEAIQDLFGRFDDRTVEVDPRMRAVAQARAQKELPTARARFQRGLEPGGLFFVQRGFSLPGGRRENMWVRVTRWDGETIAGRLANQSKQRKDLKVGKPVELRQADVLDWYIQKADGTYDGKFMEQMMGPAAPPAKRSPQPPIRSGK